MVSDTTDATWKSISSSYQRIYNYEYIMDFVKINDENNTLDDLKNKNSQKHQLQ